MADDPAAGASRAATDGALALPYAVHLSRRFVASDLFGAPRDDLASALERISDLQRSWYPADPVGWVNLSRAGLLHDRVEGALTAIGGALERDPTSPSVHRLGALVFHRLGRRNDALEHLAEAQALADELDGPVIDLTDEDTEWIRREALQRRIARYPRQRVSTTLDLARFLKSSGEGEEARSLLGELSPHPEVEVELARWDLGDGDFSSASQRLEGVTRRTALPSTVRVRAWALLAEVRDQQGDAEGALDAAREALSLAPESTAPYVALAGLAERRGEYAEALEHLRRAWGISPTDIPLLLRIASVAERAGRSADARLALERAVEVDPSSPELAARLVDYHLRRGQFMEAAMRLSRALDRHPADQRLLELANRLRREVGRSSAE
jgi:Tfp pilus assembly protein PilF